jgi:hypothetical protein
MCPTDVDAEQGVAGGKGVSPLIECVSGFSVK